MLDDMGWPDISRREKEGEIQTYPAWITVMTLMTRNMSEFGSSNATQVHANHGIEKVATISCHLCKEKDKVK